MVNPSSAPAASSIKKAAKGIAAAVGFVCLGSVLPIALVSGWRLLGGS